ncbi:MAG: ABC transporter ATP-binding protein [Coprobacillus sp.]|nr:ABC transporter ATP-binding protein [Coprobacillus sp.]
MAKKTDDSQQEVKNSTPSVAQAQPLSKKEAAKAAKKQREVIEKNLKPATEDLDIFEANKVESEPLIKMRDVKISFKMGTMERIVINHLNLDINRGEILGLVGESGSGKTTIGRALIRVNKVTDGEILYDNVPISGKIPRSREKLLKTKIQMVFQDPGDSLNERANIDYIVSEGLRANHLFKDEAERMQKVQDIMQRVGLRVEFLSRFPHEFSGGQRQRIGIARCMVMNPEFVIADEPISALDVSIRAQILNLIKEFQQERNMTVLFIAHDLSVVRYISDRIAVIYAGNIVELTEANRLFEVPLHPYTKSLLTAVPIPDPSVEKKKKIVVYNPREVHHYMRSDPPKLVEIEPGHWVRCDSKEKEQYEVELKEKIAKLEAQKRADEEAARLKAAKSSEKGEDSHA